MHWVAVPQFLVSQQTGAFHNIIKTTFEIEYIVNSSSKELFRDEHQILAIKDVSNAEYQKIGHIRRVCKGQQLFCFYRYSDVMHVY